ncbi:MAG: serine hydrolase [Cyclobacteriaceae bacterium]
MTKTPLRKAVSHLQLVICFILGLWILPSENIMAQDAAISQAIDQLLSAHYPTDQPGATVLVAKDGKVIFRKAYGLATLAPLTKNTLQHTFRIGSITKQFTAVAILQLVNQNKLKLNDPIRMYLPDYPEHAQAVTIENLLTHTSGIKSYTDIIELRSAANKAANKSLDERMNDFKNLPLEFEPGTKYRYSNSGYFLLGRIIEKVSGLSYANYLKKNIIQPLGLSSTYFGDSAPADRMTKGYKLGENGFEVADYVNPFLPFSAGALTTSVEDLLKWDQAVFTYKVLPASVMTKAWGPFILKDGSKINYGYGWSFARIDDLKVIDHGGFIDGFFSYELNVPEKNLIVCILSNSASAAVGVEAFDIARIAIHQPIKNPTSITVAKNILDEYQGVYEANDKELWEITSTENSLVARRSRSEEVLVPFGQDQFFVRGSPDKFLFSRNQKGAIQSFLYQGYGWINTQATKTNQLKLEGKKSISMDNSLFDQYVGEYELAPQYIVTVWREGSAYKAQASGQPVYEIFPESDQKFFLSVADVTLEFLRDDQQKVTGLVLSMGGHQTPGKKVK